MAKVKMTYESACEQLDEILLQLSDDETPLDDALKLYAKAAELMVFCDETLKTAQMKVDEISAKLFAGEKA